MIDTSYDSSMIRLKKLVYKNRIRVKEFLTDFDRLRSGFVHANHFCGALSMAGIDKHLTAAEIQTICDAYSEVKSPSLIMVDYKRFLYDVDVIFTIPELERTPLVDVAKEPSELLDKTRYLYSSRVLNPEVEDVLHVVLSRLQVLVSKRGTQVKPFFDDFAADDHSAKLFGHVTAQQFRQCLSTKLDLPVTDIEAKALAEKFANDDKPELVNYIAFANIIDPPEN